MPLNLVGGRFNGRGGGCGKGFAHDIKASKLVYPNSSLSKNMEEFSRASRFPAPLIILIFFILPPLTEFL